MSPRGYSRAHRDGRHGLCVLFKAVPAAKGLGLAVFTQNLHRPPSAALSTATDRHLGAHGCMRALGRGERMRARLQRARVDELRAQEAVGLLGARDAAVLGNSSVEDQLGLRTVPKRVRNARSSLSGIYAGQV